jgi:hypothetical protein
MFKENDIFRKGRYLKTRKYFEFQKLDIHKITSLRYMVLIDLTSK